MPTPNVSIGFLRGSGAQIHAGPLAQGPDCGYGLSRGSFGSAARGLVVRLKGECARITVLCQRVELSEVVYGACPHLRPVALLVHVLEVDVGHAAPDVRVAGWKRLRAQHRLVAGVPDQAEGRGRDAIEHPPRLGPGCDVTLMLV